MSRNEKDYSSYLAYESLADQVLAVFMGFTFTAITLLLTLLPDPSQVIAQVVLFFLALVFYLFQFLLSYAIYYLAYCIRDVPPEARGRRTAGLLWLLGFSLWGGSDSIDVLPLESYLPYLGIRHSVWVVHNRNSHLCMETNA